MAALDPEIISQFDLLSKAKKGLDNAKAVQEAVKKVLEANPEDKTALRVSRDADTMVSRFRRHVQDAQKVVSTLSRKTMPESLKRYAVEVARRIRMRLEDPNMLEVIPWQRESYHLVSGMQGVEYQVVFRIDTGDRDIGVLEGFASEFSTGSRGVLFYPRKLGRIVEKAMSPETAVDEYLDFAQGWEGLKGESKAIDEREGVAQQIASVLNGLVHRFDTWRDPQLAEIERGNTRIIAGYRSGLPKEGERSVGESEYREMVHEEIKRYRQSLDPALRQFASSIRGVRVYDGEKSWIYTEVELK
jgi:hypothetical protein